MSRSINRIRPPFARNISAMAGRKNNTIYYIDDLKGTLNRIDVVSQENMGIVNHCINDSFQGSTALWVGDDTVQYAVMNELLTIKIINGEVYIISRLVLEEVNQIVGIVHNQNMCFLADRDGLIIKYDANMFKIESWDMETPINSMTLHKYGREQSLFLLSEMNRSVYVYNLQCKQLFSITVPHEGATSIASIYHSGVNKSILYISYVHKTWEIYDNTETEAGNSLNIEIDRKARNVFIEKLLYKHKRLTRGNSLSLSNGYRVEFKYFSMLSPRHNVLPELRKLRPNVRMSIPTNTERQTVVSVNPIGQVYGTVTTDAAGEDIIEFDFTGVKLSRERVVFGYKAVLDLYNIRYMIDQAPFPAEFPNDLINFLRVEKRLDMHRKELQKIAAKILSSMSEANRKDILRVVWTIREYVYDKLEYHYNNRDTSPLQTLKDGEGTCGKYTELLLGLLRLCGVPCRAVGDYKVPDYKLEYGILHSFCRPDYDHVWIEFYVPEVGWVPMESSSDNLPGKHNRFFAALPWVNIENSRTQKSMEDVVPDTWKIIDERFHFSDFFEHEISITVTEELE
ncbi:MAG TPA: transglutaminase domain-containing protein [Victivallales bacterium]|nr:transglutaminase domain-containing protein [Victivallales bacterium]